MTPTLRARAVAELVGTALLVATVVGSGVMATRLTDDLGVQLLANSLATGAVLVALITALRPVSAAFNPVVTLVEWSEGSAPARVVAPLVTAQVVGGIIGAVVANVMFDLDAVSIATHARDAPGMWLGEVVATAGLVLVVLLCTRAGSGGAVAWAVAGWIVAAYWFTSSTSFANPAVTVARMLSDTFAGISPASVPGFVLAQLAGAGLGRTLFRLVLPHTRPEESLT